MPYQVKGHASPWQAMNKFERRSRVRKKMVLKTPDWDLNPSLELSVLHDTLLKAKTLRQGSSVCACRYPGEIHDGESWILSLKNGNHFHSDAWFSN